MKETRKMKKTIALGLICLANASYAEPLESDEICIATKNLAERAMIARQSEMPKEVAEQASKEVFSNSDGGVVAKLNYNIIIRYLDEAYQEDIMATQARKKITINKIGATAYLECLETFEQ